jgi:hypothetical protein
MRDKAWRKKMSEENNKVQIETVKAVIPTSPPIAGGIQNRLNASRGRRGAGMLSAMEDGGGLTHEASEEPVAPAVVETAPVKDTSSASSISSPPPVVRRRGSMLEAIEQEGSLSPEPVQGEDMQMSSEYATSPVAAASLLTQGGRLAVPSMEEVARREGLSPSVDGTQQEHVALSPDSEGNYVPPAAPTMENEKIEEEDGFPEFSAIDAVHGLLMNALITPRRIAREDIEHQMRQLNAHRAALAASIAATETANNQVPNKNQNTSGATGLLAGLGAGIAAVGKGIGQGIGHLISGPGSVKKTESVMAQISEVDSRMSTLKSFRHINLDTRYLRVVKAADAAYKNHQELTKHISDFNSRFSAHEEGAAYLAELQKVADRKTGGDISSLRSQVHDFSNHDEDVLALRSEGVRLSKHIDFADDIQTSERLTSDFKRNMSMTMAGIENSHQLGVNLSDAMPDIHQAFSEMQIPNAALAKPGGERPDQTEGYMKQILERIRAILDTIRGLFSRSSHS